MRAVVAYESIFGSTRAIAEAVGEGLRLRFLVLVTEVSHTPAALVGVDLLVAGGPAHVSECLGGLPEPPGEVAAAAFHTAVRTTAWLAAHDGAEPAARRLEALGYRLLVRPEHFYVKEVDGPLEDGELERARAWGVGLADAYVVRS
jgi:hypothetical protein